MTLTSPVPPQDAANLLKRFSTESGMGAFTEVLVGSIHEDQSILSFTLTRRGRVGRSALRLLTEDYPLVSYVGTLTPTNNGNSTLVEINMHLDVMAYVMVSLFIFILLVVLVSLGRDNFMALMAFIAAGFYVARVLTEVSVYSRIRETLQYGYYRP